MITVWGVGVGEIVGRLTVAGGEGRSWGIIIVKPKINKIMITMAITAINTQFIVKS